jgi:GH25 family lysozyme M1 (1,4-beta-N-acetylmuramidase)
MQPLFGGRSGVRDFMQMPQAMSAEMACKTPHPAIPGSGSPEGQDVAHGATAQTFTGLPADRLWRPGAGGAPNDGGEPQGGDAMAQGTVRAERSDGSRPGTGPVPQRPPAVRRRPALLLAAIAAAITLAVGMGPAGAATGIDVSRWQHPNGALIDWSQVRAAGHRFAFVKATDPVDGTNPWFATDWAGAAAAGLYRGAYHRARPGSSSGGTQGSTFVAVVGSGNGPADLPPVLDLEETGGLAPAALVAWAQDWLATVQALTGRTPIVYTGYYFWRDQLGATTALRGYRLWLPQYTTDPAPSLVPAAWPTWTFWQHSSTGTVPGVPAVVDLDRYCCTDATLAGLTGAGSGEAGGNPFGSLDAAAGGAGGPGTISAAGWAIDPDTPAPIAVHLYVDDAAAALPADRTRPDVAAAFPGFGAAHGFATTLSGYAAGPHRVCAYAINTGTGTANVLLGCRTVTVPGGNPFGVIDTITGRPGALTLRGWALDPDTANPVTVHIYVDGTARTALPAADPRPDVAAAYPGYGPDHGYEPTITGLTAGNHTACAYAINTGTGTANTLLGCRTGTVPGGNPFGVIDTITGRPGALTLRGWALDPDTANPVTVHIYVDGTARTALPAADPRPDVAAAYPGYGPDHGYEPTITGLTAGNHTACAYAINIATGTANTLLGCGTATVP